MPRRSIDRYVWGNQCTPSLKGMDERITNVSSRKHVHRWLTLRLSLSPTLASLQ